MGSKKIQFADHGWWVGGLLGVVIGLSKADGVNNQYSSMALAGIVCGVPLGWILGFAIDSFLESSVFRTAMNTARKLGDERRITEVARTNLQEFQDAKHRFKYLSDETLVAKYNEFERANKFSIHRLALEEEMVNRGLLEFSKMHEKLDLQKDFFDGKEGQKPI
jgi:hypothetical protein